MKIEVYNKKKRLRITDLYLIYVLSGGDVRRPVTMDVVFNHGNDSSYGRSEKAKTVDYFVQKNWVVLDSNAEHQTHPDIHTVYITASGIDQAEAWEEQYSLDKRLTGRSYWLTIDWRKPVKDVSNPYDQDYLIELFRNVDSDFNEPELKVLCFELSIDYDDLPGSTRTEKCLELIGLLKRQKRIPEFIQLCSNKRPNTVWQD
jgi:hypothetical protein